MRNNRYEVVELRYNAAGDVVTDVKQIARTDTNATNHLDKIYGYPFAEILTSGHKVADNESIYDVVLNGYNGAPGYTSEHAFTYVERPRMVDNSQHNTNVKTFTDTAMGTLRLQGRTMYVLDGQHDYGIDFIRDAKAVVRQPEGTVNDWSMKNHAYSSVQEAIDSLGDAVPGTQDTKEFKGIITAVLNSQGVAEWIVFYSDTPVETKTDTGIGQATMDVVINVKFPGADSAEYWRTIQVKRPAVGNIVDVDNPDVLNGSPIKTGFRPKMDKIPVTWEKGATNKSVTFEYEAIGSTVEEPMTLTINIILQANDGTFQSTMSGGTIEITKEEAGAVNAPNVDGYAPLEPQKAVTFVAGGNGSVTFTYKALGGGQVQPTPPASVGGGHPDPAFAAAYAAAGIEVLNATDAGGKVTFTIKVKEADLLAYLTDPAHTIMNQNIDGTNYAFVGFYFDSPVDADGTKATQGKTFMDGNDRGIGMDGDHRLFQWIAVARYDATAGKWVKHQTAQHEWRNEWTMTDSSVINQLWTVVTEFN